MNKVKVSVTLFIITCAAFSSAIALVQPRGTDSTFDLLTWNVHEFPGSGFRTIDTLAVLINDLDIDMIAFQEIADTNSFYGLLDRLPNWEGFFAPYDYPTGSYLKTAIIWRPDRASVTYVEQLFIGNEFQFPRPPIHATATVNVGGGQFDFHIIDLHLKALSDEESRLRRRAAILMLKAYLDNTIPNSPDQDWIVLGDYNDQLEDPQDQNVFWPLLIDSLDYRFLTLPMAGNPYWASYPYYNSLIDHILISSDANYEYGAGTTITLRLDDEYPNYANRISDHRPVMAQFIGYSTAVDDDIEPPSEFALLNAYPNPFNAATTIGFELRNASDIRLDIFDITGRKVAVLADGRFESGAHRVTFDASALGSGTYFARLISNRDTQAIKLVLIK